MLTDPVRIESYDRLNNSVHGNPRYRVITSDGEYLTSSDTSASYEVPNNAGKRVRLELTRAYRITKIHPVEETLDTSTDDYSYSYVCRLVSDSN